MNEEESIISALSSFRAQSHEIETYMGTVSLWFSKRPKLKEGNLPVIHSIKSRLKSIDHLERKIRLKMKEGDLINGDNIFEKITDLAGVRVLHLYQDQFKEIHKELLYKVEVSKDWVFAEPPKAYTWDPESKKFFEDLGVKVEIKESSYTSVHYLVKPRVDSILCCEIQVRTLFEEVWGEIDHALNYPEKHPDLACREQLLVLSKIVGAGSRLADSIFRISNERGKSPKSDVLEPLGALESPPHEK